MWLSESSVYAGMYISSGAQYDSISRLSRIGHILRFFTQSLSGQNLIENHKTVSEFGHTTSCLQKMFALLWQLWIAATDLTLAYREVCRESLNAATLITVSRRHQN